MRRRRPPAYCHRASSQGTHLFFLIDKSSKIQIDDQPRSHYYFRRTMILFLVALLCIPLHAIPAVAIDPHSDSCQTFLLDGLSKLIPGINLAAPLTQCLNDAKTSPYLKSCILSCKCTLPPGSFLCNGIIETCGLNCAVQNQPPSCSVFFGDVISNTIGSLSKLNEAYSYIAGFFECLFSAPEIPQPTLTNPPSTQPPPIVGNCPTAIGNVGPASCGSIPGVQNTVDCQLQGLAWVAYRSANDQIPCAGIAEAGLCGQSTFPTASYWCSYCGSNPGGSISGNCFNTWFDVTNQPLCASYVTCPPASSGP